MNDPKTFLDAMILDYDGVDTTDGNNANLVQKRLRQLQQIYTIAYNFREWPFTFAEAGVTINAASNSGAEPANFGEWGFNGGLWDPARKMRLEQKTKYLIERARQESSISSINIFGMWDEKIQLAYAPTSNLPLTAFYRLAPDVLAYDTTAWRFPVKYTEIVLMPAMIAIMQNSKQDSRDSWMQQLRTGLGQMCAMERPIKTATQRLPMAVRRAW